MRASWRWLLVLTALLGLWNAGCLHTCYLMQAAHGQDDLSYRARLIDEVVADEAVPERTRALLALIDDVKRYGEGRGLTATESYKHFTALDRPAVVWMVSASHPLRFEPKTWFFPIIGSVPYLGWFDRRDADRYAEELRGEGLDVDVRGASAYSTLGWFDDPVLSTMIRGNDTAVGRLVNVVLHESVHATHYVNSQSLFNESLANFVADALTLEYLEGRLRLDRWQRLAYQRSHDRAERRARRLHEAYKQLDALYHSDLSDADKLDEKRRVTGALGRETGFARPINNATLAQSRAYNAGTPLFAELLTRCEGDWGRFWTVVRRLDEDAFPASQHGELATLLKPAVAAGCR